MLLLAFEMSEPVLSGGFIQTRGCIADMWCCGPKTRVTYLRGEFIQSDTNPSGFGEHLHGEGENITLVAHGLDVGRLTGIVQQTLAQAADQQIDGAVEQVGVATLGQIQQLIAAEHPLRMIEKHPQQAILGAAEGNHGVVFIEQVAGGGVQAPAAEREQAPGFGNQQIGRQHSRCGAARR